MISYPKALAILRAQDRLSSVELLANDACGYVAAQDVISEISSPPFPNSAVDGFAVCSAALAKPVTLPVVGKTAAGDGSKKGDASGVWEIMTGAPVPEAYDAVVKIEDVIKNGDKEVSFVKPVLPENNIRKQGEDFSSGDVLIKSGSPITPFHIMAFAAAGKMNINVAPKAKITLFSTGKELVGNPNQTLQDGQIRDSNTPYLMAAMKELPACVRYGGLIKDSPEKFNEKMQEGLRDTDIFISTGAVSAGKYDFIPKALADMGADILFHKVAVKPGKPIIYARLPNGAHYFGLPGNPVSASVGLRFFVIPLLHRLQGMAVESSATARLLSPFPKKQGLRFFCKAFVSVTLEGKLQLKILSGQESFKIYPLLAANCWANFTEEQSGQVGEAIEIYPLMPSKWNISSLAPTKG